MDQKSDGNNTPNSDNQMNVLANGWFEWNSNEIQCNYANDDKWRIDSVVWNLPITHSAYVGRQVDKEIDNET